MTGFCKGIRIGPVYIYLSTVRMKRRSKRDNEYRNRRHRLRRLKHSLYVESGGRCMECGARLAETELQLHHVKPWSTHPGLVCRRDNLRLLCHACHARQHMTPGKGA